MKTIARCKRTQHAAIQTALVALALSVAVESPLPHGPRTTVGVQLARAATQIYKSHWHDDTDDRGADVDKPIPSSTKSGQISGFKSGSAAYNPERIQKFWSHYHGARPGPKEKPLEIQPRDK